MRLIAFLVLGVCSLSATAESWLCVSDESTGFNYDKASKSWVHARFKPGEKYVVRPAKAVQYKWEVIVVGEPNPMFSCANDFATLGDLECEDFGNFRFNRQTLKFAFAFTYGYFARTEEYPTMTPDSMVLAIGRCTAL